MTQPVTLPLWLLLLILAFAAVAALTHVFVPPVRWFFRRRMERLVERLNARLDQPIRPFKLMRRPDMIVRLVHDPEVMEAVVAEAAEKGEPESVVFARARRYAKEIVPAFSATVYFGFATRAAKSFARMLYKVRIGHYDAEGIAKIDRDATVVFVMNHRSNMDYVLVTHLVAERSALSYAVGEWARIWPLSGLIRAMGAYFIRRRSGNPLYRRVLAHYVSMATEEGVTQAIFPEGGLSLDGRVGRPKLGLISYILGGYREGRRDVVFVPVALSYDRVLEDRVLIQAAALGIRRFRARVATILAFVGRNILRKLFGRYERFGFAAVSFGTPLSLREFLDQPHRDAATELARELMSRVTRVVTVLPVPLVAAAFGGESVLPRSELIERAERLADELAKAGAHLHLPDGDARKAAEAGIHSLSLRGILRAEGDQIRARAEDGPLLAFYAASILQLQDALAASNAPKIAKPKSGAT
ncbi:1-acyl-sn-glycerol-3-phosphate acyltransferase [Ostreiculturibacter nitratireducens]|uniref:1-acyl-sn-glycerol-3-phosphate acyltransferase n=1 Tax=Ostreiculturibacter nitratireducens TaxID=3075226 RepID=UPI0031B602FF